MASSDEDEIKVVNSRSLSLSPKLNRRHKSRKDVSDFNQEKRLLALERSILRQQNDLAKQKATIDSGFEMLAERLGELKPHKSILKDTKADVHGADDEQPSLTA